MKEFNTPISDQDLSELLKGLLISTEADNAFSEQIMAIECKKAFTNTPLFVTPSLEKEKELLKNLNSQFGHLSNSGWLLTGIGTVAIVTSAIFIGKTNVGTKSTIAGTDPQHRNETVMIPAPNTPIEPSTSNTIIEKKADAAEIKNDGFKYFSDPPSTPSGNLNLYEDLTKNNVPTDNTPGINDTLPRHTIYAAGVLHNRSNEKNKLAVDTIFKGIKKLEVEGPFINLNVTAAAGDDISLKGELNYEMKGLYVKRSDYKVHYERNGTTLKVWMKNEGKHNTLIMGTMNCDGYLKFEIPAETELIMKNKSGNINVKGMSGNICNIEADFGHIKAEDIHNNIQLKSLSGDITATNINGDINVKANFGHIVLKDVKGDIEAKSMSGNIDLQNITGNAEIDARFGWVRIISMDGNLKLNSTSGNILLKDIKGEMLSANATFGHISITGANTEIKAFSKSGDITLADISGNITATSHFGNQSFSNIKGDIKTKSSSGSVTIKKSAGETRILSSYGNVSMTDCAGKTSIDVKSGDVYGKDIICSDSLNIKAGFGNIHMSLKNNIDDLSFDLNSTSGHMKINKENMVLTKDEGNLVLRKGKIVVKTFSTSGDQLFD